MLNEVFSDCFAHKDNFLTKIDARIKIVIVFALLMAILFLAKVNFPIIIACLVFGLLLSVKTPIKIILFRMLPPLSIVAVILCVHIFLNGWKEGLSKGILIATKVVGATSLVIFLGMTTPLNSIIKAASWFKVPKAYVEIAAVTYRYIFVLLEQAITIRDAQKVRLGYSSLSKSLHSLGELIGTVFIRAYDQSIAAYESMRVRGYKEDK